jgi:hypothetical protein
VQLSLITPVFLALLGLAMLGGLPRVLMLTVASLPFGMLAVVNLPAVGGISILAANLSAAALVGLGVLMLLTRLMRGSPVEVEPATFALAVFAIYAIISATILVRLFAGDIMVFSLARGAQTVQVETAFAMGKVLLAPSTSNLSQTFYILVSACFFVIALHVLTRFGPQFGERSLAISGCINIVLGLLDFLRADALLAPIRTANYALLNFHTVSGMNRIVGGFPEPASFGTFSVALFAYFATSYLYTARPLHLWLAIGNGLFGFFSLSATGLVPLGLAAIVVMALGMGGLRHGMHPVRVVATVAAVTASTLAVGYAWAFTDSADTLATAINRLIFEKHETSSGIERSAWAMGGLEAFRESWGLGVGVGSLRSNGLVFSVLGSMGIVGALSLAAFLGLAFGSAQKRLGLEARRFLASARLAGLSLLLSFLLAATSPDPGLVLVFFAAMAVAAKRMGQQVEPEAGFAASSGPEGAPSPDVPPRPRKL